MTVDDLTLRQQEVLVFICESINANGRPPTRAEIAKHFSFNSVNAAESHLRSLERKGAIRLLQGSARGIEIVAGRSAYNGPTLPVIGHVAAGVPILAQEHIEDTYRVDPRCFSPAADYLLRVHGESMINAGILNGDLVAVYRGSEVSDGQIVIARIDDDVAVKRLSRSGDKVRLLSENPDFDPIVVDLRRENLIIEGVVVGLLRKF